METESRIVGCRAIHPGEFLGVELEARGIKQKDFAKAIGVQPSHLNEFIKGKRALSPDWAIRFEQQLGIKYQSWMNHQAGYDYDSKVIAERKAKAKAERRANFLGRFGLSIKISQEAYQALSGIKDKSKYVSSLILQAAKQA